MKIILKRIFYILFIFALYTQIVVYADTLKVEKFSTPIKIANKISQPVNISFATSGKWKLFVESMDSQIHNQENPGYSIPITRLELAELGGRVISNFDTGKVLEATSGIIGGVNSVNIALNSIIFDSDRAGDYIADLKFTLKNLDNNTTTEEFYNFRFTQDEIAKIDFTNKVVNLKLDKDKILQKNSSQNLLTPVGLYVSSNKDWKLYIRSLADNKDKNLRYFMKVLGGDPSINYNLTSDYIPITENTIFIASGKATTNNTLNYLDKKLINIDYMVKGPEDKFIKAGSKSTEFEYRLETEN